MSGAALSPLVTDAKVQAIINLADAVAAAANSSDRVDYMRQLLMLLRRWEGEGAPLIQDQQIWGYWKSVIKLCLADGQWQAALDYPAVPLDHNYNLMSAEHYAFARYIAKIFGDPNTDATLNAYFWVKNGLVKIGAERLLRTSANHPVLEESTASLAWKSKGVVDGLEDYRKGHGGKLGKPNSSRSMVWPNAVQQYKTVGGKVVPAYAGGS